MNLQKMTNGLVNCINNFLFVDSLVIVTLIIAGATLRYLFSIDFMGMEDIVMLFAISLYFMGGALASYKDDHISADVVTSFIQPGVLRSSIIVLRNAFTVVAAVTLVFWSVDLLSWSLEKGVKTQTIKLPVSFHNAVMAVSFVLMAVYETNRFVKNARILSSLLKKTGE